MKQKTPVIKVAHLIGSLKIGGAERFIIDLSCAQKLQGLEPTIISLGEPNEPLVEVANAKNVPVVSFFANSLVKRCKTFIALINFDVIHIHSPHALKFIYIFLPILNKRIIYTRHGAAPWDSKKWLTFHKNVEKRISAVTFVSQEGQDNFRHIHHWYDTPSVVIDNGVLTKPINKNVVDNQILRLGSVGRMIPLKNQIGLLKSITLLSKANQAEIALHFFGDGKCAEQLKNFTTEHLPQVNVNFHGMMNDREKIYSSIDLLVVTSETEGLSMVIMEAMANKIPVIATNVGGNPKLVIDQKTGWLFEYDDDQKLADIVQKLLAQRHLINEFGNTAFDYIEVQFSIDTASKKYADLYNN